MTEKQTDLFDPAQDHPFVGQENHRAEQPVHEETTSPAPPTNRAPSLRLPTKRDVGYGVLAAGAIIGGVLGLEHLEGGSDASDRGALDPSIVSITLNEHATLRLDPTVDDATLGPNSILHLEKPVEIDASHDVRVLEGTNNGTWYGIPLKDIANEIPSIEGAHDNDGLTWVNEQGVESVQRTE